jgi:predicted nucleotide-binding protein
MEKTKQFDDVKFDSRTISAAVKASEFMASSKLTYIRLAVRTSKNEQWQFNTVEEFLASADRGSATIQLSADKGISLYVTQSGDGSYVSVGAPTREQIEAIFSIFENNVERCRLPESEQEAEETKVFIGHGRDPQWRDLKDHLHEKHEYSVEAYEIGSRAGHTIRDILEEMLEESSFALLVMTGEDETKEGKLLARQNVVHEAGLFQGRLGFSRAIILLEDGTEEFSNIAGLQQIRFSKGNIKESFGDVLAVLKREME